MLTQTQITESEMAPLRSLTRHALSETIRSGLMVKATGLWRDRRGSTAILFALAMPMLIGALGIGFEVSNWYMVQARDAECRRRSRLGGSVQRWCQLRRRGKGGCCTIRLHQWRQQCWRDSPAKTSPALVAGTPAKSATITNSVPLYLSPVVGYAGSGGGKKNLVAAAIAKIGTIPRPYCLLALASSGTTTAITTSGAPSPNLAGCSVKSNTSANCNGHDPRRRLWRRCRYGLGLRQGPELRSPGLD